MAYHSRRREGPRQYIGVVATRCRTCTDIYSASALLLNERTYHYCRDDVPWVQLVQSHWYGKQLDGTTGEVAGSGTITVSASIEYPSGVFNQVKWGGSATVTISGGATVVSDRVYVKIPKDAKFYVRRYLNAPTSLCYVDSPTASMTLMDTANGDITEYAGADKTMGGTLTQDGTLFSTSAVQAIIGPTRRPSFGLIGDSRVMGWGDTVPANVGDIGQFARTIGPKFGYINMGVGTETVASFIQPTHSAGRRGLLKYVTHVCCDLGGGDYLISGDATAALTTGIPQLLGMQGIAGKRVFYATIFPITTSTDGWTTQGNQTVHAQSAHFEAFNNTIKQLKVAGVFDPCLVLESTPGSSMKWTTSSGAWTADGTHPNAAGYAALVSGKVIDLNRFRL
jgi:hypothetical protein